MKKDPILSAGIVPIYLDSELEFLILRAYQYWDFPKGLVEKNEDPFTAAKRELFEETCISQFEFTWGEAYTETEPYAKNKVARYYLAQVKTQVVSLPINPELGRPEHNEYRWIKLKEAEKILTPRILKVIKWAHHQVTKAKS